MAVTRKPPSPRRSSDNTHSAPTLPMAVDPYAPCPCGSGKKLKFCCSDLVHEIEKVHRKLEGDQPRAALALLDAALAKAPGRASLLDLKTSIQLSLGDDGDALETVNEYLRVDSQNPSAHAQAALVAAAGQRSTDPEPDLADPASPARRTVDYLQSALELVTDSIPMRVLQAIGAAGQALLSDGHLIAARAHLWLYQGVAGEEDTRAMELLMRLNQVGGLPLLLRDNLFLREAPLGHACDAQHDHAQLLASRGQWRRASEVLETLCEEHPELAILRYNAAVVAGWLGDTTRFVAGLREFARLTAEQSDSGLPDDAIEAEAIAQLLDPDKREAGHDVVRTNFEVADEESLIDRLTRDDRTSAHRLSESELQATDGPPPRNTWLLLDRSLPESGVDLTIETAPRIVGVLSYYGRQTDRPERLELVADRSDEAIALAKDLAGDAIGGVFEEEVIGQAAAGEDGLNTRWRFPNDTPVADRRRLIAEEQRRVLLEQWPDRPRVVLGGESPRAAAAKADFGLPLVAAVLVLEQTVAAQADASVFAELREKLGLPASEAIDPTKIDADTLPMARVGRVDLKAASDDALLALYKRTELSGATEAALAIAREAINRPGLAEELPPEELYGRLAALEPDIADALGWVDRARESTSAEGKSCAVWDLAELELRVVEGQFEEANQLVHHLRDQHLNEPGIAERLYQMLQALGAVPAQGAAMPAEAMPPEAVGAAAPADAGGSKLWTPGGDEPAGGGGGGQKIWTPS